MTPIQGRATDLAISSDKVQKAYDFLNAMIWTKTRAELQELYTQVAAKELEFTIVCADAVPRIVIKIWAESPIAVRDNVIKADGGFWKDFRTGLDAVIPTALEIQPCIL